MTQIVTRFISQCGRLCYGFPEGLDDGTSVVELTPSKIAYCIKNRFLCSTKKIVYEKHRPSAKSRAGYALFVIMECSVNA